LMPELVSIDEFNPENFLQRVIQSEIENKYLIDMNLDQELNINDILDLYSSIFRLLMDTLQNLMHIGPSRFVPNRYSNFVDFGTLNYRFNKNTIWNNLAHDARSRESINYWLASNKKLRTPYEIDYIEYYQKSPDALDIDIGETLRQTILRDKRTNTVVSLADVGYGVSQILPILLSALSSRNKIFSIEQPELHVHPALQAELGDVFVNSLRRGNSFILETHSEHILLRLLRRIKETTLGKLSTEPEKQLFKDQLSIIYVDAERDMKQSEIVRIRVNELGELVDDWPGGFFPERIEEVFI